MANTTSAIKAARKSLRNGARNQAIKTRLKSLNKTVKLASAGTDAEKKKLAEALQLRAFETVSHVPLGQYNNPAALRANISGLVPGGAQVYWNIKKN